MKKLPAVIVGMFLMASLAACSNGTDAAHTPAPGTTQPTVASTPATEPASEPAGSEAADATLATIDIDVYCAGTSHADDPIEPGFEAAG